MQKTTQVPASPREDTLKFLRAFARTFDSPTKKEEEARLTAHLIADALHSATC